MAGNRSKGKANPLPTRNIKDREGAEALAILMGEVTMKTETPEPGYFTINEWAEKLDLHFNTVRRRLRKGEKTGIVKMKRFRILFPDVARTIRIKYYKIEAKK